MDESLTLLTSPVAGTKLAKRVEEANKQPFPVRTRAMRFAFNLVSTTPKSLSLVLYDASTINERHDVLAQVMFEKADKGGWITVGTRLPPLVGRSDALTVKKLAKANESALNEGGHYSPLTLCRALLSLRSVQVVHDVKARKFRCIGTMKEGADTFELVGTTLAVDAKDEETAVRLGKREVAERMQEFPEDAVKLAAFFANGCKVKKIHSGSLPDYIKVDSLAYGAEEEKLAKQPIKITTKEDKDE